MALTKINNNTLSAVTTLPFDVGITVADQWRLTTNFNGAVNPIASNLERVDTGGQGFIGTAMSESSGVFTFPSTGIYLVSFHVIGGASVAGVYHGNNIQVTTNNSSYTNVAASYSHQTGTGTYIGFTTESLVDVTDTTNVKVRFTIGVANSSMTTQGNSTRNDTFMTFTRLGDT